MRSIINNILLQKRRRRGFFYIYRKCNISLIKNCKKNDSRLVNYCVILVLYCLVEHST